MPVGYRSGELVVGLRIGGRDPTTRKLPGTTAEQLTNGYANLARAIAAAGGGLEHVAQVSFFFSDLTERALINEGWLARFPDEDDRPTYKFMAAPLGAGERVALEFFAVLGATRTTIAIPGVAHLNPIPLAVRAGAYLFSSRILPYDPQLGAPPASAPEQAHRLFENLTAVLDAAGMSVAELCQGRGFLADLDDAPLLEEPWRRQTNGRAPLHLVEYEAGALKVMLEVIAKTKGAP